MAAQPGSSGPSSNINSPTVNPGNAPPLNNNALSDLTARSSPAPSHNASLQADGARSKRNKRDSRKKREAKGLDPENIPPKKKTAATQHAALPSIDLSILRPLLLAEPRSPDRLPPQYRQLNFICRKTSKDQTQNWDFYEVIDKLSNKNGFRYSYAIADPGFPHIKYRQTDVRPYHARFSFEDSPPAISFTNNALAVTTNAAWHSARANVCAREGTFYYEARVINGVVNDPKVPTNGAGSSRGHVRLGFARREADLDANVGIDCYGYGIRDVNGEVVNRMRCEYFFPKDESIKEGDVIGMLITLPPFHLHKKVVEGTYDPAHDRDTDTPSAMNLIRDRIPFHYKGDFCWQQSNIFPSKQLRDYAFNLKETPTSGRPSPLNNEDASLRTLPGSSITIFKNGTEMGTPFKELYAFLPPASRLVNGTNNVGIGERENADDGMIGYYPAVSCYGGGAVECRFEAPWWIGPPPTTANGEPVRAMGERYGEQIVEDLIADIVDEVEAMSVWGGVDGDIVGNTELDSSGTGVVGGSEVLKGGVEAAYEAAVQAQNGNVKVDGAGGAGENGTSVPPPASSVQPASDVLPGPATGDTPTTEPRVQAPVDEDVEMT